MSEPLKFTKIKVRKPRHAFEFCQQTLFTLPAINCVCRRSFIKATITGTQNMSSFPHVNYIKSLTFRKLFFPDSSEDIENDFVFFSFFVKYRWTSPSAVYLSVNFLIHILKIGQKTKFPVKICLFMCEFSISGPILRDIPTSNNEAYLYCKYLDLDNLR